MSKKINSLILGMGVLFLSTACNQSTDETAKDTVKTGDRILKGEILDLSCFMVQGAQGESHKKCAQGCLDGGLPAGILAEDGQVYLLLENHDMSDAYQTAIEHAAEVIQIEGKVITNRGMQAIVVNKVNTES